MFPFLSLFVQICLGKIMANSVQKELIEGVVVKPLKKVVDERGFLMEILRSDWQEFEKFGQCYITVCNPDTAKAWHYHKNQADHFVVLNGKAKIALYDARKDSKTFGKINEFIMSLDEPFLLKIPKLVFHGFTPIGNQAATILNIPTQLYNYSKPDEFRRPYNWHGIKYDWGTSKGDLKSTEEEEKRQL